MNMSTKAMVANKPLTVALAGNPNSGKTTIFNQLTGLRQHVGNYPGVTVEKKEGWFTHRGRDVCVIDLPGIYSLTASSEDERVARDYVLRERPDLVVDVVDAANLERSLYLAVEFMELGLPLILAFNMSDIAEERGYRIDADLLSRLLGVSIVFTVGHKGQGLDKLKDVILSQVDAPDCRPPATVRFEPPLEREITALADKIQRAGILSNMAPPRWVATKLLEGDEEVTKHCAAAPEVIEAAIVATDRLRKHYGENPAIAIAGGRYGFISGACQEAVQSTAQLRHTLSDQIDAVVTSRVLGLPIFLGLMYLVFKLTFTLGAPAVLLIESFFAWLADTVAAVWPSATAPALRSLVTDGIIAGVGGVVTFLPNVVLLFAAIAILEDSGYMARAAFIMDRWMHKIGLHGQSFIPMVLGFGCTVPAIMATRILQNRRDRLTTILVLPLMSCGARFPIYTLFIPAFFPAAWQTPILMLLYVIGVVLAVFIAKILRSTIFKGDPSLFVMELPPYHQPTLRAILLLTWERAWLFLRKAGTVILGISVVLWFLTTYPRLPADQAAGLAPAVARSAAIAHSYAGRIGHVLAPVMATAGFDWKTTTALIGGFAAKEVFVAQLGIINALGEGGENRTSLSQILQRDYTRLQAFCIMLFCLISMPCAMTVIATAKESGSWRWAGLQLAGLTLLGYIVATAVYQTGLLLQKLGLFQ